MPENDEIRSNAPHCFSDAQTHKKSPLQQYQTEQALIDLLIYANKIFQDIIEAKKKASNTVDVVFSYNKEIWEENGFMQFVNILQPNDTQQGDTDDDTALMVEFSCTLVFDDNFKETYSSLCHLLKCLFNSISLQRQCFLSDNVPIWNVLYKFDMIDGHDSIADIRRDSAALGRRLTIISGEITEKIQKIACLRIPTIEEFDTVLKSLKSKELPSSLKRIKKCYQLLHNHYSQGTGLSHQNLQQHLGTTKDKSATSNTIAAVRQILEDNMTEYGITVTKGGMYEFTSS